MENQKKNRIISKAQYYELMSYQKVHQNLLEFIDSIEILALEITQELDKSDDNGRYLLGGYTSEALNQGSQKALDDVLKILGIEVEKDKVVEVVRNGVNKVSKKKKKDTFKSGRWQKNDKLNKPVEVVDGRHLHYFNEEFINNEKRILTQNELDEIMMIGAEVEEDENVVSSLDSPARVRVDWDDKFSQFDESDDSSLVDIFDDMEDEDIVGEEKG